MRASATVASSVARSLIDLVQVFHLLKNMFPLVGIKGNLSLLEYLFFFFFLSTGLNQMEEVVCRYCRLSNGQWGTPVLVSKEKATWTQILSYLYF